MESSTDTVVDTAMDVEVGNSMADRTIEEALFLAQQAIVGIAHNAENKFSGYTYTSAEQIISCSRTILHQHGLYLTRTYRFEYRDDPVYFANIVNWFVLRHPASGGMLESHSPFPVILSKGKPHDKAVGTALTTSLGYFYRDLLQLPRPRSMDEMDQRNDESFNPQVKGLKSTGKGLGKSVVELSMEQEGPVNQDVAAQHAVRISELAETRNAKGLTEYSDALDIGMNLAVWHLLQSDERRLIKSLIKQYRQEAQLKGNANDT